MAGTVSILISGTMNNGGILHNFAPGSTSLTQTNDNVYEATLTLSTTEEAISFTDFVGDPFVFIENLDSTNTVHYGLTTSYPASIKAGDPPNAFRVKNGATLYVVAAAATPRIHIVAYDE